MLRPRGSVARTHQGARDAAGEEAARRLAECADRVEASTKRLGDASTHTQAARSLAALASECAARRDALRAQPALRARCAAALCGSDAVALLLRSPLPAAAAAAAAAVGACSCVALPGFVLDSTAWPLALAHALRHSDAGVAAAAAAALTQLLGSASRCDASCAAAALAVPALLARLAACGGSAAPWLTCAAALASAHASGASALRADASAAAAALRPLLFDAVHAHGALALCAALADADAAPNDAAKDDDDGAACTAAAPGNVFATQLLAHDEPALLAALQRNLLGANASPAAAASALRLLACLAATLPHSRVLPSGWSALAPHIAAAVRVISASGSAADAAAAALAISALLCRTQRRGVYGAPAAASAWRAPLVAAGAPAALLAAAQSTRGQPASAAAASAAAWRALTWLAARGGALGDAQLTAAVAAAATAVLLAAAAAPAAPPSVVLSRLVTEPAAPALPGAAAREEEALAAGGALLTLLLTSPDAREAAVAADAARGALTDAPRLCVLAAVLRSGAACAADALAAACAAASCAAAAATLRDGGAVVGAAALLARAARAAGLRGPALAQEGGIVSASDAATATPWGAWAPPPATPARWSAAAAVAAMAQLRCLALTIQTGDAASSHPAVVGLLEGLAAPSGGLGAESRCWAALALRCAGRRCGARTVLGEDLRRALEGGAALFADVALACGAGGAPQHAHAALLAARCPQLLPPKAMPSAVQNAPVDTPRTAVFTLRGDVAPTALTAALQWAYAGSCDALEQQPGGNADTAARFARAAGLHTLAALLLAAPPRPGYAMPSLAADMRRCMQAATLCGSNAVMQPGGSVNDAGVRAHRFVLSARSEYLRAALSPDFARCASAADGAALLRVPELCARGVEALVEFLYTGRVRAWHAACDAPADDDAAGVAARVAAAADARLLPELAAAARSHALSAMARLPPAAAAAAAAEAAAAGEWGIASAAVHAAAAGFAQLRDSGALDALPPALADALRAAHVARVRDGTGDGA